MGLAKKSTAWAVQVDFDWGRAFVGPGWFGWPAIPDCAAGCRISLFETRAKAREHMGRFSPSTRARVVKVQVTIEPIPPPPTGEPG